MLIDHSHMTPQKVEQRRRYWIVLVLPVCFVVTQLYLRGQAGPFWQWNLLDPSYFYLLDGLNLINGDAPGHIFHPGVTVHAFNATLIWIYGLIVATSTADHLLDHPELYLHLLSNGVIILNATGLTLIGVAGRRVFETWLPGLACQLAPFMSSIVLKHAFLPKPEALLVFSTATLISLALLTLISPLSTARRNHLAIGFGVVAGFILATKITAAPILILPLFLMREPRLILIYGVVSVLAFVLFFLPAIEVADQYLDWLRRIATGTGVYGSGPKGVIDIERYSSAFAKVLKRPSLKVPLILALLAIAVAAWRFRRGREVGGNEIWLIVGVSAAQLVHAALVAKQPTAFYMIPSYMLAAVSVLFAIRLLWRCRPFGWGTPLLARTLGAAIFAGFIVAQTAGVIKLAGYFETLRNETTSVNDNVFRRCARIYHYAASAPVFAMYLADYVTGSRFATALKKRFPANDYWIDDWWDWRPVRLKNWTDIQEFKAVIAQYPCVYVRGKKRDRIDMFLKENARNVEFDTSCATGSEIIRTHGIDCKGQLK